jgi:glycosyltransferase involved in cell wall biosynthesis
LISALSDKEYLSFLTSLDAYVMLSMGEGFSVTPREAMALGLPVILSENTGHHTICESGLVNGIRTKTEIPAFYEVFNRNIGEFFLPDVVAAADSIRNIFDQRDTIYSDAGKRRDWAAQYDVANLKGLYIDTISTLLKNGMKE